jgi:hypothetical protein
MKLETIRIDIVVEPNWLSDRSCLRCKSTRFKKVLFLPLEGSNHGNENSGSSIPLAICYDCKRLVSEL